MPLASRVRSFDRILDIRSDAAWLNPPVTDDQVRATEQALGHALPDDLVEMYSVHNGGHVFNGFEWLGALDPEGASRGKLEHFDIDWFITEEVAEHTDIMPGQRTLRVAT
ncbi:MAG TPA: SMI1/KNR4 family protein, partial [Acidimicrobiales bacterium]|nr:SMI1/KNR4 family protein [Acidimicrobiales bacterium]